jgi:CRP-like cAMP-binding protein
MAIWSEIYSTLTDEEANALYYAMRPATYDVEESIFVQGKHNSKLYFIRQGRVKLVWSPVGREVLLETLGPGKILGEDTFFGYTVCTTSVIALSRAELDYIEKDVLNKWRDEFPGLESRLRKYCLGLRKTEDLLKKKGLDRRGMRRVNLSGKARVQLLDASGGPLGTSFKVDLSNISIGGLAFIARISKWDTDRLLLGRNLNVQFFVTEGGTKEKIDQSGTIVGIRPLPFHDYCIHVRFDKMLSGKLAKAIGY